jgi:hypothetical protein
MTTEGKSVKNKKRNITTPSPTLANSSVLEEQENYRINTKVQYGMAITMETAKKNYYGVWENICEFDNRINQLSRLIMLFDTTLGARIWLRRSDIVAVQRGQALELSQCVTVTPEYVYRDNRVGAVCYEDTPVRVNGTIYFIAANNLDLKRESTPRMCGSHGRSYFRDERGRWHTAKGPAPVTEVSNEFARNAFQELPLIMNGSSPYQSGHREMEASDEVLRQYISKTNNEEEARLPTRTETELGDPLGVIEEIKKEAKQKIDEGKQWIDERTLQIVLAIAIPLGIIALVVSLGVLGPTCIPIYTACGAILRGMRYISRITRRKRQYADGIAVHFDATKETVQIPTVAAVNIAPPSAPPQDEPFIHEYIPRSYCIVTDRMKGVIKILVDGVEITALLDTGPTYSEKAQ